MEGEAPPFQRLGLPRFTTWLGDSNDSHAEVWLQTLDPPEVPLPVHSDWIS